MRFIPLLPLFFLSIIVFLSPAQAAPAESWSYDSDQTGEDAWGMLNKNYAACTNGKEQSPVQIGYTQKAQLPPLTFRYDTAKAHLEQKDYTLVADVDSDDLTLSEKDMAYRLKEIRFHTPSEHETTGRFWPLEIQFTHRDETGKTLIVSVLANPGEPNPALQTILDHVGDNTWMTDFTFNPQSFIPKTQGYYAYTGSLTIPPCTEGVEWRILKEAITVSHDQLAALEKITHRNARLSQPAYMRTIMESTE